MVGTQKSPFTTCWVSSFTSLTRWSTGESSSLHLVKLVYLQSCFVKKINDRDLLQLELKEVVRVESFYYLCWIRWGNREGRRGLHKDCSRVLEKTKSINSLVLLYNPRDSANFHSGCWNSCISPDLAFATVDSESRLLDKVFLEKSPRSQHWLSLIISPRFALPVPSMPIRRWNFRKTKWSRYIALTNKFA